ncbi:antibiotic biosynthesis monooxygenase [Mycobacterium lepromatosis]|uniref:ABM domain-containing protein n=1 Tax=Mycobacterium lepromatosis TaxID=480418 RepID=A0A0F4ERG7_9MYCO|nr:hypothetical protein MLPM_0976 [Mycobacterium lepromatosis]UKN42501.1 antibiotic biosynthesis monooxygenase [Mycobacterium lepromatosis]
MPVVVASLTFKPESIDTVRDYPHPVPAKMCTANKAASSMDCTTLTKPYMFVKHWANAGALQTHSNVPAITTMVTAACKHLARATDIKMPQAIFAGNPSKGQLRR